MYQNKPYANGSGTATRPKKERKLSILIKHTDPSVHCAGVESLVVSPDGSKLFTASRDSTVKRWSLTEEQPAFEASFEDHVDWVNDVLLFQDFLVSCSNDKTVKLSRSGLHGECFHTFQHHTDYVTRLASAPYKGLVYSGGLRSEIFAYDMQAEKVNTVFPPPQPQNTTAAPKEYGSIYALASNGAGTLLAVGTTQAVIRVLDPRTQQKGPKLRGHTENIRALALNEDGTLLLSASSDHTLRLWDIGQQRCIQVHHCHSDSVWALAATPEFTTVYSGGRDCCVFRTSLTHRTSELAYRTSHPVTSLAYQPDRGVMWLGTTASSVTAWNLPLSSQASNTLLERRSLSGLRTSASGRRPASELRNSAATAEPLVARPSLTIQGAPNIVEHRILADRRYVLAKDSEGQVTLWDVVAAQPRKQYGRVDIAAVEAELARPVAVPAWYSCDHRLGVLQLHLEPPGCFGAEVYAADLGWANAAEDYKLNYGVMVLRAALRHWVRRHQVAGEPVAPSELEAHSSSLPEYGPRQVSVTSSTSEGRYWRKLAGSFTGQEAEGAFIPVWAADAAQGRKELPYPRELKAAFILLPAEGSNLPSLLQSRLNAPRILEVRKVANYCQSKLAEQRIEVAVHLISWNPKHNTPPPTNVHILELTCNGLLVPHDLSISAVKALIWKRSDDVIFHFRIRDPANPAPMPVLIGQQP